MKIYDLRITYDYERATIQYYRTIKRGNKRSRPPKGHSHEEYLSKIQLSLQLQKGTYEQWNRETRLYDRELHKTELGMVAELHLT